MNIFKIANQVKNININEKLTTEFINEIYEILSIPVNSKTTFYNNIKYLLESFQNSFSEFCGPEPKEQEKILSKIVTARPL